MIFVTTGTKAIFELTGRRLIESFLETNSEGNHLVFWFEDLEDPKRDTLPPWIPIEFFEKDNLHFVNIMTHSDLVERVDTFLEHRIEYTDEYSSPRSLKWFRPVAAIKFTTELFPKRIFCSIDADCEFTGKIDKDVYKEILEPYNVCYLGRKHFKIMQHGDWRNGEYVKTGEKYASDKDTHTETGFIGFNCEKEGTNEFIEKNLDYWTTGDILDMKYKTDCHTFDATVESLSELAYNNMLESYGTTSPIGSKVLEVSPMGKWMTHNKGTLGPQLYNRNEI